VIARHVDVGQAVKASVQTPISSQLQIPAGCSSAEIAESDVGTVRAGSKAAFQIESIGNQSFEGTVSSVRLQPLLQQVVAPARGGPPATPQAVTSTPMPVGSSSAQPSIATSPGPTGTSGTAGPAVGQPTPGTGDSRILRRHRYHPPLLPAVQKVPLQHLRQHRPVSPIRQS
jgi:hypothetical protein